MKTDAVCQIETKFIPLINAAILCTVLLLRGSGTNKYFLRLSTQQR
jgi:hypothetical protein